jgi:hypothetical protein
MAPRSVNRTFNVEPDNLSITHDERERNAIDVRALHKAVRKIIGQFGGVYARVPKYTSVALILDNDPDPSI